MSRLSGGAPSPGGLERLLVAALSILFLYLMLFREGTFVFLFVKAAGAIDEGARIVAGEIMYRDFFEFLGPGMAHLSAALIGVFGHHVAPFGHLVVFLGSALACLLHSLAARVAGPRWRLLPPLAFTPFVYLPYQMGNHKFPALLFGLLALSLLVGHPPRLGRVFLAGIGFGLASLFTQDFGFGLIAGVSVFLLVERARGRGRSLLGLWLGYSAPLASVLGFFAAKAGFARVLYDLVVFPMTVYVKANGFNVWIPTHLSPRDAVWLVLVTLGIAGALMILRGHAPNAVEEGHRPWRSAALLASAGIGLFLVSGVRGAYLVGLAVRSTVLLVCAARALELMAGSARPAVRWTGRAALAVLAVGVLHGSVGYVVWRQSIEPLTRERHRAGEVWVTQPMPELSWIESQTRPGDRIFVFPAGGGLFFLSRTRNATSFPYMLEGQSTVAQQERALAEIEENRPLIGVWYQGQRFVPRPGTASLDTLYRGIVESYDLEKTLPNGAILLRRKSPAGAL